LSGGQAWWDRILEHIRTCDYFLFLLESRFVTSMACRRELEYAVALNKSILPIQVGRVDMTTVLEASS